MKKPSQGGAGAVYYRRSPVYISSDLELSALDHWPVVFQWLFLNHFHTLLRKPVVNACTFELHTRVAGGVPDTDLRLHLHDCKAPESALPPLKDLFRKRGGRFSEHHSCIIQATLFINGEHLRAPKFQLFNIWQLNNWNSCVSKYPLKIHRKSPSQISPQTFHVPPLTLPPHLWGTSPHLISSLHF